MANKQKAKEAIWYVENCMLNDKCEIPNCAYYGHLHMLDYLLEYIYESEPVIRCTNCKHYNKGENESDSWAICKLFNIDTYDEFYCANGEKKQ